MTMMTEQIDLKAVKMLIDSATALKSEVSILTKQLQEMQWEKDKLATELATQTSRFEQDATALKLEHTNHIETLQKDSVAQAKTVSEQHQAVVEALTSEYEAKLASAIQALEQKNQQLSDELIQAQQQNHLMISRIRGVEV